MCQLTDTMREFIPSLQQPGATVGGAFLHWRKYLQRSHPRTTAYAVSTALDIDPASVSRFETGKQQPSIQTLVRFMGFYRQMLRDECGTDLSLHACIPGCTLPDPWPTSPVAGALQQPFTWRLRELREEANIHKQYFIRTTEIAAACHVTPAVLDRIDRGESSGTVGTLRALYSFFRNTVGLDISLDHVLLISPTHYDTPATMPS